MLCGNVLTSKQSEDRQQFSGHLDTDLLLTDTCGCLSSFALLSHWKNWRWNPSGVEGNSCFIHEYSVARADENFQIFFLLWNWKQGVQSSRPFLLLEITIFWPSYAVRRYKTRRHVGFGLSNNYLALPALDISKGVCIIVLHQSFEMFLCDGSNVMVLGCLLLCFLWPATSETAGSGSRTGRGESFLIDTVFAISTSDRLRTLKTLYASVAQSVRL